MKRGRWYIYATEDDEEPGCSSPIGRQREREERVEEETIMRRGI